MVSSWNHLVANGEISLFLMAVQISMAQFVHPFFFYGNLDCFHVLTIVDGAA